MSAPLLFPQAAMGKLAARFALRYPDIRLEVTTEDRAVDMVEEGDDLLMRVNPGSGCQAGGTDLHEGSTHRGRQPDLKRPSGRAAVRAVARGQGPGDATASWEYTGPWGRKRIDVEHALRLSSLFMVRDAARAGVGAARLPLLLVTRDLTAGTLVRWGDVDGPEIALWALYQSRRLLSSRVSTFLDFLKEAFSDGSPDELASFMK